MAYAMLCLWLCYGWHGHGHGILWGVRTSVLRVFRYAARVNTSTSVALQALLWLLLLAGAVAVVAVAPSLTAALALALTVALGLAVILVDVVDLRGLPTALGLGADANKASSTPENSVGTASGNSDCRVCACPSVSSNNGFH